MGSPDITDGRSFPSDLVMLTAPLGEQAVDTEAPVFFWSPQDGRRVPQLIGGEKKAQEVLQPGPPWPPRQVVRAA